MDNKEVLDIFKSTGAMLNGHFLLTSGRHSDTYMQCAKLFVEPSMCVKLCGALADKLKKYNADAIVSPAIGGIVMGYEVARALNIKNYFAERENGAMALRRGFTLSGERVIVVEDAVTTGGSVKEVIELVGSLGCTVAAVGCIVDRSGGKVDFGVPFESLLSMDIVSYPADECPLCKTGIPAIKPGSRNIK